MTFSRSRRDNTYFIVKIYTKFEASIVERMNFKKLKTHNIYFHSNYIKNLLKTSQSTNHNANICDACSAANQSRNSTKSFNQEVNHSRGRKLNARVCRCNCNSLVLFLSTKN